MNRIHHFLRDLLPAGHIHTFCFLIVKGVGEKQNMEVSLNIPIHTAGHEVNI